MALRAGCRHRLASPRHGLRGGADDDGEAAAERPGGELRHAQLTAGVSYSRDAGVEHDVINDNDTEFVFVEIEMK
jgi:hypothetical protein